MLLVRPGMPPTEKIESLLVPLDISQGTEVALRAASEVARACHAGLNLAVVVPTVETLAGDRLAAARLTPLSTSAALEVEEEQAVGFLERTAAQLSSEGLRVNAEVRRGDTVSTLAQAAQQTKADLIVIATHARSGLNAVWAGSVASSLSSKVSQPMLLVKI